MAEHSGSSGETNLAAVALWALVILEVLLWELSMLTFSIQASLFYSECLEFSPDVLLASVEGAARHL